MNNPPAFPFACDEAFKHGGCSDGMTLRDYFAAKAMHGFIINQQAAGTSEASIAQRSFSMAEAMLKARANK